MKRFRKVLLVAVIPCLILSFLFFGRPAKRAVVEQAFTTPIQQPSGDFEKPNNLESMTNIRSAALNNTLPERKIIHNGEITIVVKHYEPFFKALQKQLAQTGGYFAQVEATRTGEEVAAATIRFRVPPDKLDVLISWLAEQGVVASERVTAEDISEQYFDLKARLENAQRFEERLLLMLKTQTGKLNDIVLVEEKLNQVREQVEQLEGKLRLYNYLVDLATVTLNVKVEQNYIAPHRPSFGERTIVAWHDSTHALKDVTQATAIFFVAITPWMIPLMLLGFVVRYAYRFILRSRLQNS